MKKIKITFLIIGFLFSVAISQAQMVGTPYIPADCEKPAQPGVITGSASVTAGATGLTYSVAAVTGATSYVWTVTGDGWSITAGQNTDQITVTAGSANGTVSVKAHNDCGDSDASQTLNVTATPAIVIPTTLGAGSLSGRTCFDIAETEGGTTCGTLESRLPNQADFKQTATNTQTYTFTAAATGTVKNVRYVIQDPESALLSTQSLSGTLNAGTMANGTTATLQVQFKTNLNSSDATPLIVGRTRTGAAKVTINIIYNNGSTDVKAVLTANIQDCMCCGAMTTSGTFLQFMCHNLGADESLDPFTYVAGNADGSGGTLGWLFQWGRPADGHQLRTSGTTTTLSGSDTPGNNLFITNFYDNSDWRTTPNDKLWNAGTESAPKKAANDPCPSGYRVPTDTEWNSINIASNWAWTGNGYQVGSALYLPAAGWRDGAYSDGSVNSVGGFGGYWSSTPDSTSAYRLSFSTGSTVYPALDDDRAFGWSVRCVAE